MINFKDKHKKNNKFCFGLQDQLGLISYSGLQEQIDYLIIDGIYFRTLYISGFPFVAHSGWLENLINFNRDIDISFHIEDVEPELALPKLNRKITEIESTKQAMIKSGKIVGSDIADPLESAIDLRNRIQRGQEKLFLISIYITLRADSLSDIDKLTKLIESALAARMFFTKIARYQQLAGLQSILPRAEDRLNVKRNMDSSSAALCFPFISSELVQENGILYGINKSNNSLVMLDRFSLNNANSITFAQSGSGKSYATKVEILRQLMQGVNVIVIDPEREYSKLTESVKGTYIKLSANTKEYINPFDLNLKTNDSESEIAEHVQDLTEIIALMVDGLSSREKAVVDKSIMAVYAHSLNRQPLLTDFYKQLILLDELKLAERLDKYISGSLSGVFSKPTSIDLNNRLIVFDIKDLSESLRQIMMLVIANFVQNKIKQNLQKRLLVIDEGWLLLEHEESARFVSGLVRRARKYWLGVAIISQQANDFLSNEYGRAIASQSSLRILMRQDTTTIQNVTSEFQLSEYENNYLLTCDRGEALIVADLNHVALTIVASSSEHPLITTDPNEMILDDL